MERTGDQKFDERYMDVLKVRALESLDVYEFDSEAASRRPQ